ncbi:MAG: bifunctional precorrin-2 dehydrogenase/sirohydrochlorin ferrochelatase [Selenomonadaceae bacterium]|nr:bifunctional precorrin-2 dehydrogenase/sirohydrochlorin ferrochelatase [Selenomonadaceae bacterium]
MHYPINLKLSGRRVFIIGGGRVAQRRVDTLLKTEARITVIAPALTDRLAQYAADGKFCFISDIYRPGAITALAEEYGEWPRLVIIATPDETANGQAADEAHSKNILVNMAAPPMEESDFIVPSHIERGQLLITIATGGLSPAFSRFVRLQLEKSGLEEFADFLRRLSPLRRRVRAEIEPEKREQFWRSVLTEELASMIQSRNFDSAEASIENALGRFGTKP